MRAEPADPLLRDRLKLDRDPRPFVALQQDRGIADLAIVNRSAIWPMWALTAHSPRIVLTQDLFASGEDLAGIMHALR